ncbi:alpha/beta hydrolase [Arthrobacter livingstonensis]|uniref:Alpha/beta hydrolase n=1 Tax=Arthrobacter livingstonensis TaxID=670078 RepID=A0A2V5LFP5_9MICC|nr:alpha/beta hydrolase [Arthrobacter livingstonensis]PYI65180.1 alpha/beta hydrolase [Arthrobacter livingstonensis]
MIFKKGLTALAAIGLALLALLPIQPATAQAPTTAPTQSATSSQVKPTIVLVHGAWADGSSWAPVSAILQAHGYSVLVPPNPLRGLSSDAASISAFIQQATTGPVVLVGHSYGGAVITNAATSTPTVKALVYVDAFAPAQGQTLGQIIGGSTSALNVPDPTTVFNVVADPNSPAGDGDLYLKPSTFNSAFAQDLPRAVRNILSPAQRPLAVGANLESSGTPAWAAIPSWFVVGTADKVIPQTTQLQMAAAAGGQVTKVNASHLSLLSKPLQVAQVITQAAHTVH